MNVDILAKISDALECLRKNMQFLRQATTSKAYFSKIYTQTVARTFPIGKSEGLVEDLNFLRIFTDQIIFLRLNSIDNQEIRILANATTTVPWETPKGLKISEIHIRVTVATTIDVFGTYWGGDI